MNRIIFALGLLTFLVLPISTKAALSEDSIRIFNDIPTTAIGEQTVANRVFNILTFVAGAVAIIYLIIGALQYTTAGGDEDKAKTARLTIVYAVVGIIIVLSSAFIFRASTNLLSVPTSGGEVQQQF